MDYFHYNPVKHGYIDKVMDWPYSTFRHTADYAALIRPTQAALLPVVPAKVEIIDVSDHRPKKIPSPQWRECIKKVWEVDPLACPRCGSEMKIISFINEAEVIRKILEHLDLWEEITPVERAPPITIPERRYEPVDDGWPQYEEPLVTVH